MTYYELLMADTVTPTESAAYSLHKKPDKLHSPSLVATRAATLGSLLALVLNLPAYGAAGTTSADLERPDGTPVLVGFVCVLVLVLVVLIVCWKNRDTLKELTFVHILLLILACLSAGGLLGFLFGIPQAYTDAKGVYRPSNSLEQIADWLTKIIVGLGLVEFNKIRAKLAELGKTLSSTAPMIPQLLVVMFSILGLVSAYTSTRLYYGELVTSLDMSLASHFNQRLDNVDSKINKVNYENKQLAKTDSTLKKTIIAVANTGDNQQNSQSPDTKIKISAGGQPKKRNERIKSPTKENKRLTDAPEQPEHKEVTNEKDQRWETNYQKFMAADIDFDQDDTAILFGHNLKPKENGQQLSVEVTSHLQDKLYFRATVTGTKENPLGKKVILLLHPSFRDRAPELNVIADDAHPGGIATYYFSAFDGFTLVATPNNGKTMLGYDLQPFFGKN